MQAWDSGEALSGRNFRKATALWRMGVGTENCSDRSQRQTWGDLRLLRSEPALCEVSPACE